MSKLRGGLRFVCPMCAAEVSSGDTSCGNQEQSWTPMFVLEGGLSIAPGCCPAAARRKAASKVSSLPPVVRLLVKAERAAGNHHVRAASPRCRSSTASAQAVVRWSGSERAPHWTTRPRFRQLRAHAVFLPPAMRFRAADSGYSFALDWWTNVYASVRTAVRTSWRCAELRQLRTSAAHRGPRRGGDDGWAGVVPVVVCPECSTVPAQRRCLSRVPDTRLYAVRNVLGGTIALPALEKPKAHRSRLFRARCARPIWRSAAVSALWWRDAMS